MRILLAQRLPCFPALTGEAKLNQALLARLAARNHACRIIALASSHEHPDAVVTEGMLKTLGAAPTPTGVFACNH